MTIAIPPEREWRSIFPDCDRDTAKIGDSQQWRTRELDLFLNKIEDLLQIWEVQMFIVVTLCGHNRLKMRS